MLSRLNVLKLVIYTNFSQVFPKYFVKFLIGNKEGLQELHEAYQILLKIIMGAKNRFKKKSQVLNAY